MELITICYHYKYTPDYVESLDIYTHNLLLQGLVIQDSRNKLFNLTVSDYPRMEDKDRKEIHKHYKKLSLYKDTVYSNKEALQKLKGNNG